METYDSRVDRYRECYETPCIGRDGRSHRDGRDSIVYRSIIDGDRARKIHNRRDGVGEGCRRQEKAYTCEHEKYTEYVPFSKKFHSQDGVIELYAYCTAKNKKINIVLCVSFVKKFKTFVPP